jgi:hypothetical protein
VEMPVGIKEWPTEWPYGRAVQEPIQPAYIHPTAEDLPTEYMGQIGKEPRVSTIHPFEGTIPMSFGDDLREPKLPPVAVPEAVVETPLVVAAPQMPPNVSWYDMPKPKPMFKKKIIHKVVWRPEKETIVQETPIARPVAVAPVVSQPVVRVPQMHETPVATVEEPMKEETVGHYTKVVTEHEVPDYRPPTVPIMQHQQVVPLEQQPQETPYVEPGTQVAQPVVARPFHV